MSALKLRSAMVVVDQDQAVAPAGKLPAPPLRTLDLAPKPAAAILEPPADGRPRRVRPARTFLARLRGWLTLAATLALIGAYPAMVVMASDVGDKLAPPADPAHATLAWVGGASQMMETQYGQLGWAHDAYPWSPMARLTAKPAYQQALADALGDLVSLKMAETGAGAPVAADADLSAASRLLSSASTGVQMRAARDALVNYDRRVRRRGAEAEANPAQSGEELKLILSWAAASQSEIGRAADRRGNPIDRDATIAVYTAKGRARVAALALETMPWPALRQAENARNAALAAWRQAAEFHPLLVLNGDPDGSIIGNHPTSMGFALARAATATQDLLRFLQAPGSPAAALSDPAQETAAGVDVASLAAPAR
jgi:hypothetical protein